MTSTNPPEEKNPDPDQAPDPALGPQVAARIEDLDQALGPEIAARIEELEEQLNRNTEQRKSILMELHLIAVEVLGDPKKEQDFSPYQEKYVYESDCQCGCPDNCVDCLNSAFVADLENEPQNYVLLHGLKEIESWMEKFFTEYMQNICSCRMNISADGIVTCSCRLGTNQTIRAETKENAELKQ